MSASNGFEQYRILLKELSKPKVNYEKLKSGIKGWSKSLNKSSTNRRFLERLRCKGFTNHELGKLTSKVVVPEKFSLLWSKIIKFIKFESLFIPSRQTLRDIVIRLIDTHKSFKSNSGTSKLETIKRRVLSIKLVAILGLLLVLFNIVSPQHIESGGIEPLSKYIETEVPTFKLVTPYCKDLADMYFILKDARNAYPDDPQIELELYQTSYAYLFECNNANDVLDCNAIYNLYVYWNHGAIKYFSIELEAQAKEIYSIWVERCQ